MATTYELIASQTLGSNTATVTFSSIPGTYDDLMIQISARSDRSATGVGVIISFNGISSSFTNRWLDGTGTSVRTGTSLYSGQACSYCSGSLATSDTFSSGSVYIPNYSGPAYKSFSAEAAQETNATTSYMVAIAGLWSNTAAITSIGLATDQADNFVTNSSFYLYGITKS